MSAELTVTPKRERELEVVLFTVRLSGAQARNEPPRCSPGVTSTPHTAVQMAHDLPTAAGDDAERVEGAEERKDVEEKRKWRKRRGIMRKW